MSKTQERIFWPTILIALVASGALVFVVARARTTTEAVTAGTSGVNATVVTAKAAAVQQTVSNKPGRGEIKAVLLTLRPEGFEPKRITRAGKPFVLVVNNRSQSMDVAFRLDRVGANRVHEGRMKPSKRNWTQLVDLEPGNYRLSVADHPDWVCQITITER